MKEACNYLKDLKCLDCSHATICFRNKGGADLTLAAQDCADFDMIDKRGTVLKGTWVPKEIMIRDPMAKNYRCSICNNENYVTNYCPVCGAEMNTKADDQEYDNAAVPKKFWILFDVPGFYDITEYNVTKAVYDHGVLERLWGEGNHDSVVAYKHDFDRIVFFSKVKAQDTLNRIIKSRRVEVNGEM